MCPKISVIIPVLNREKLIEICLESILNQKVKPYELIVVDNNSSDSTYSVVNEWMNNNSEAGVIFKLLKEEQKGACNARDKGFENSEGDYLIFFDSDDRMLPDLIAIADKELRNDPELDLLCWKSRINLLNGQRRIPAFEPANPIEGHLVHALLRPQGYIIRKQALKRAGGWKKPVEVWNDYELGLRILLTDPKIKGINKVLAEIYAQEDSITGRDFSSKEGKWEKTLQEMINVNEKVNHKQKERIGKILNYRKVILAAHYYREGNKKGALKLFMESCKNIKNKDRLLLNIAYFYTKLGGRGIWKLIGWAY